MQLYSTFYLAQPLFASEQLHSLHMVLKSQLPEWSKNLHVGELEPIYGNFRGGVVLGDWLHIATFARPDIWGLYPIRELQATPQIREALAREPGICYFMDAANVWYYGVRDGELWCYDTDPDEFYSFGPMAEGFEQLLRMYESTSPE
jgi:hypothetical protein